MGMAIRLDNDAEEKLLNKVLLEKQNVLKYLSVQQRANLLIKKAVDELIKGS